MSDEPITTGSLFEEVKLEDVQPEKLDTPKEEQPQTEKPKRKSYYVPVAQRKDGSKKLKPYQQITEQTTTQKARQAARRANRKTQKNEAALREGQPVKTPSKSKPTAPTKKVQDKQTEKGANTSICSFCGKPLSRHSSVEQGMGDTCASKIKLLPKGTTIEEHYAGLTVPTLPAGYIKLKDAIAAARKKGISGYRFLQAIGGDRMLRPPLNSNFKTVLHNRTRYVNGNCLKHLDDLKKV